MPAIRTISAAWLTPANFHRSADGDAAGPGFSYLADTDTGLARTAANTQAFCSAGTVMMEHNSGDFYSGETASGSFQIRRAVGTAAAPNYTFRGDPDTGFYRASADELGFAAGGLPCFRAGGQVIRVAANTALTAGGVAGSGLIFGSSGTLGVYFGSGAPTLSAPRGSLYLRSDGAGATSRIYVNTDGGTTWTYITCGA